MLGDWFSCFITAAVYFLSIKSLEKVCALLPSFLSIPVFSVELIVQRQRGSTKGRGGCADKIWLTTSMKKAQVIIGLPILLLFPCLLFHCINFQINLPSNLSFYCPIPYFMFAVSIIHMCEKDRV